MNQQEARKLTDAGIGHVWPESLYAVIGAAGGDLVAVRKALGLHKETLHSYRLRLFYPIWEHAQRKFRLRGWGDYELPMLEPGRRETDEALEWIKGLHGNGAGDDDTTTPENIDRPSVAWQMKRVERESVVYDALVAYHMTRDARGPSDANALAYEDVQRHGIDTIADRVHRGLTPIPKQATIHQAKGFAT